jgi:anti-sigma B factor antagonist
MSEAVSGTPRGDIRLAWLPGGVPVVCTPVEVDFANSGLLRDALARLVRDRGVIIVDMTGNVFCDSSVLSVLVQALRRARAVGGEVRLVMDGAVTRRVSKVTGADRIFQIFSTIAAAASAGPAAGATARDGLR